MTAFVSGQWGPDTFVDTNGDTLLQGATVTAAGYVCTVDQFGTLIVTGPASDAVTLHVTPAVGSAYTHVVPVRPLTAELQTVKDLAEAALPRSGGSMTADLVMGGNRVTGLADPASAQDAATRAYVLSQIAALINSAPGILDTLGEIAAALQADEGSLAALTSTVAGKAVAMTVTPVKTADYAAAPNEVARFDLTGGSRVLTFPTTPTDKSLIAGKIVATTGTNTLTVNCGGTDTVNRTGGVQTFTLSLPGQGFLAEYRASDGTWTILADDIPLSQLDLRFANLNSPALTGTPTAPTAAPGTNTTQIATMAAVKAAIDALIAGAPGALDTLNEIAAQLATDESAVSALTTTVASKAPTASPTFTGTPAAPTAAAGTNTTQVATTAFVQTAAGLLIPQSLVDAKGDLLVGSADNTVIRKAVGSDGQVLTADAASTGGLKWAAAATSGMTSRPGVTSGQYYSHGEAAGNVNRGNGVLTIMAIPFPAGTVLTRVAAYIVTGASAGGVLRFGFWDDNGGGKPGTLLLDTGTVACTTSSTGLGFTGLSVTVPASGWLWVGAVQQGGASSGAAITHVQSSGPVINVYRDLTTLWNASVGWEASGITGALASTPGVAASTQCYRMNLGT